MRCVQRTLAAWALVAVVFSGAVRAADEPASKIAPSKSTILQTVPENALGLVVINRLAETDAKLSKLTERLSIPNPGVLNMLKMQTGAGEGVDDTGSAAIILAPGKTADSPPLPLVVIPVTDYKKFIGQFAPKDEDAGVSVVTIAGQQALATRKGNFAIFGPPDQGEEFAKAVAMKTATDLGPIAAWVNERDVVGIGTTAGVKLAMSAGKKGIGAARGGIPEGTPDAAAVRGIFDVYDGMFDLLGSEVSQFAMGASMDKEGTLSLDSRTVFVSGGKLAKAGAEVKAGGKASLDKLSGGPFVVALDGAWPEGWSEAMANLSTQFMVGVSKIGGDGLTDAEREKLIKGMTGSMRGLQGMGFVLGVPAPAGSLYSRASGVMRVADSKTFIANYSKGMESVGELMSKLGAGTMGKISTKEFEHEGAKGLQMTMDYSGMLDAAPVPEARMMMEKLIGPGGKIEVYVLPVDAKTVAMAYTSKENLVRAIAASKGAKDNLAADKDVAVTAKMLPKDAQWVGYFSPEGLITMITQMIPEDVPFKLPPFGRTPPIGFAATMSPAGLDTTVVVPPATLDGIGGFFRGAYAILTGGGVPGAAPPIELKEEF